jgi:hypothetical protein
MIAIFTKSSILDVGNLRLERRALCQNNLDFTGRRFEYLPGRHVLHRLGTHLSRGPGVAATALGLFFYLFPNSDLT